MGNQKIFKSYLIKINRSEFRNGFLIHKIWKRYIMNSGDNMKTLVIGGSAWDTLIHVDEINSIEDDMSLWANNVVETVGGTGAGKALCLDSLGENVTFLNDLADDEIGDKIKSFFSNTTVHLIPLKTDKSTAHTNLMHSKGKRISVFTSTPTTNPKIPSNIRQLISDTDVIFLNINGFCREYIPYVKDSGKPIVVDIHDYNPPNPYHQDFIEVADIITASGVYIPNHIAFLEKYINQGKELVVITNGSKGLIAMDKTKNVYELNGYTDFEYVDSNGAGDSFCSGFATHYIETGNVGESLKYGSLCGAMACTTYDLFNKKYTKEKILEMKKRVIF